MRASMSFLVLSLLVTLSTPVVARGAAMEKAMATLADELTEGIRIAGVRQVGVVEFTNSDGSLGGDIGSAGLYAASQLERLLRDRARAFRVGDGQRVAEGLRAANIGPRSLLDPRCLRKAISRLDGVDALVTGTISRTPDRPDRMVIDAKVPRLLSATTVAEAHVADVEVDADVLMLFGHSFATPAALRAKTKGSNPRHGSEKGLHVVQNPLLNPDLAFGLDVLDSKGKPLPWYQSGRSQFVDSRSDLFVPAQEGKAYQIRVRNNHERRVGICLQIDGLNTLYCQRGRGCDGPLWILEPGDTLVVRGWQENASQAAEFVFADAGQSLAAGEQFGEQLGLITAAFYLESVNSKGTLLGTKKGCVLRNVKAEEISFTPERDAVAVITVRYDSAQIVDGFTPVSAPAASQ